MSDRVLDENTGSRVVRYKPIVVAIHWVSALLILAQIAIGLKFADMPKGPERMDAFSWHKLVGAAILILALVRLAVRLMNPPPPYPATMAGWEKTLAVWTHRLFYFLLIALPLTGLMLVSKGGAWTELRWGLSVPTIPMHDLGESHELLAWGLIVLLGLHVLGALKHQFVDKDGVSGRMPPFTAR